MKTFSCDITLTPSEYKQFTQTSSERTIDHDQLDGLLFGALSEKYAPDELALLNRARPPTFLSLFFKVCRVCDAGDGSVIVTYAIDVPVRTSLVTRVFDERHGAANLSEGHLHGYAPKLSQLDARAGSMVRAIRRRNGTPKSAPTDSVGLSLANQISIVKFSVLDKD